VSFAVFVLLAGSPLMRRKSRRALPRTLLDGSSIASPENGRLNLIRLMPHVANLYVYDNSAEADPHSGAVPAPRQLLYYRGRRIVAPTLLKTLLNATPAWAKTIAAVALNLHLLQRG